MNSSWKLNEKSISEVKQVAAVIDGVVKKVYSVNKDMWIYLKDDKRWKFEGEKEISNSPYLNKRIPNKYRRKGMASPTLYTF